MLDVLLVGAHVRHWRHRNSVCERHFAHLEGRERGRSGRGHSNEDEALVDAEILVVRWLAG